MIFLNVFDKRATKFSEIFANLLREQKKTKGMTQQELSELLNVSRVTINYWLSGRAKPTIDNIRNLAELFHVPVSELLGTKQPSEISELDSRLIALTTEEKIFVLKLFDCINKAPDLKKSLLEMLIADSNTARPKKKKLVKVSQSKKR